MKKPRPDPSADAWLSAVLDNVSDAYFALDADWRVVHFNASAEEFFGTDRSSVLGRDFWRLYGLSRDTPYARALERAMAERKPARFTQPSAMRSGRSVEVRIAPLPDGTIGVSTHDITQLTNAQEAALLSQQRLDLSVSAHAMGIFDYAPADGGVVWNVEMATLLGLDPGVLSSSIEQARAMILAEDLKDLDATMRRAAASGAPTAAYEFRVRRPDGTVCWLEGAARFVYDADRRAVRIVGTNIDITQRKTAEAHQRLLLNELNHRVKNTLATVQAMARQSLQGDGVAREARESFEGRLAALSAAHNVLTERSWESASIAQLVAVATAPYEDGAGRVSAEGPAVDLRPKTAVALGLALHELATNAAKYGALSTSTGRVAVRWTRNGDRLHLTWTETDGPPVTPPRQLGFGARLLQRGLAEELRGEVRMDFRAEGLVCAMEATLESD